MESEHLALRPRPMSVYHLQARLAVPPAALEITLQLLQRAGRRESSVFWYGNRDEEGNGLVAYVAAPQQHMRPLNYSVPASSVTSMTRRLKQGWKPLAQIHSHPGSQVEHSLYDDQMAISKRALSIVFPYYGRWSGTFPNGVGIHEWQTDGWHLLTHSQAIRRVEIASGQVVAEDLR